MQTESSSVHVVNQSSLLPKQGQEGVKLTESPSPASGMQAAVNQLVPRILGLEIAEISTEPVKQTET